jgi:hypothetical protein
MAKIVIIGAGSGFGGRLSIDIMSHEELQHSTICLLAQRYQPDGDADLVAFRRNLLAKRRVVPRHSAYRQTAIHFSGHSQFMQNERVRVEIMNQFGYFPTESSHHDS